MMMALSRNIPWGTASMKAGQWEKKKLQGREIFNKVLGVIGFGKIGSIVADRARGLKMQVIVHDPFVTRNAIEAAGFEPVSLDELYRRADYITLHVPKLKDTAGLLNKAAFDKMKDGVMIINCARGGSSTRPTSTMPCVPAGSPVRRWTCSRGSRRASAHCLRSTGSSARRIWGPPPSKPRPTSPSRCPSRSWPSSDRHHHQRGQRAGGQRRAASQDRAAADAGRTLGLPARAALPGSAAEIAIDYAGEFPSRTCRPSPPPS